MVRRYSPDELNEILQGAQRDATRPTPVTLGSIGAQMAQAGIAALGAAARVAGSAAVHRPPRRSGVSVEVSY